MIYFMWFVFFVVLMLLFIQFRILYKNNNKNTMKRKQLQKTYSVVVATTGDRMMRAVKEGKVKKQLLPNDAPIHSSADVLNRYIKFVDHSSVYRKIMLIEENRFDG